MRLLRATKSPSASTPRQETRSPSCVRFNLFWGSGSRRTLESQYSLFTASKLSTGILTKLIFRFFALYTVPSIVKVLLFTYLIWTASVEFFGAARFVIFL